MNHFTRRAALAALLSLAVSGCVTATGSEFTPMAARSGGGVIYVYAPGEFGGYGEGPIIVVDGEETGKLQNEGFIAVPVRAGSHTVTMHSVLASIRMPGYERTVSVSPGGSAYFRIERKFDSMAFSGGGAYAIYVNDFQQVPNNVGREEIARTRQSS
jgi:hypothetical protein